jgi:hypothetical protein
LIDDAAAGEPRFELANAPRHPQELVHRPEGRRLVRHDIDDRVRRNHDVARDRIAVVRPEQTARRLRPADVKTEQRCIRRALVFSGAAPQRIELRFGNPRQKLHQRDAGIVGVVVGPVGRQRRQLGAADLDQVVETAIKEVGSELPHAITSTVLNPRRSASL